MHTMKTNQMTMIPVLKADETTTQAGGTQKATVAPTGKVTEQATGQATAGSTQKATQKINQKI